MSNPRITSGRHHPPAAAPGSDHAQTFGARCVDWLVLKQRTLSFILVLVVTGVLGSHLPDLGIDPRIDKTFPQDDPRLADYQHLRDTFGAGEDTALCVIDFPQDVLQRDTMARIHEITEALKQEPLVDAENLISLSHATFVRLDEEGEVDIGPLYTPERHESWDSDEMAALVLANPAFDQRLVSRDRRLAGFWIPLAPGDNSEEARTQFVADMRAFFAPGSGILGADEVPHLEGFAIARDTIQTMILEDSWSLLPLAFVVLLIVLAALFRQVVAPLLALTVIALSTVWTLGGMAWAGIPFNTLSACIPVMVLVASVGDVVHLLTRYHSQLATGSGKESALRQAIHHVAGPCLLTSLTTAAGFACLGLSQVEMLSEFGLPVAAGVLAAYVVTLGAVPRLLTWLPVPQVRATATRDGNRFNEALVRLATGKPVGVIVGTVTVALICLVSVPLLSLDARLMDEFDDDCTLVQTRELLEDRFGGAASLQLVLDTHEPGGALRSDVQEGVLALTKSLRSERYQERGVLRTLALPDFLRDAYHTWNQRAPEFDRLPENEDALAQLHFLYLFCPQDPTADLVDSQSDPQETRVQIRLDNLLTSEFFTLVDEIETEARALVPADVSITMTGSNYMARLVTESLVSEMLMGAGMAILLVGTLIWFFFRSPRLALLGVICSGLPLLVVLGVMSLAGITLTLSTSVVFALAFGISVDDTVHMVSCYSQRKSQGDPHALTNALRETSRALVLSTIALVLGFSVMVASNFPANRTFALLLSMTLVFALVADLLFLPALLRLFGGAREAAATRARTARVVQLVWPQIRPQSGLWTRVNLARPVLRTQGWDAFLLEVLRNRAPP